MELPAVLANVHLFEWGRRCPSDHFTESRGYRIPRIRRKQQLERASARLGGRKAVQALGAATPYLHRAVERDDGDAVVFRVEERSQQRVRVVNA
jgi:hypothetical protein